MSHEDKMALARAFAVHKAPYFSRVIYSFIFRPVPNLPTMFVTRGMVLGYGEGWAEEASVPTLAADIAHEAHHILRGHFHRAEQVADKELWNKAADLPINSNLVEEGWALAEDAYLPEHFNLPKGLTAEEYYALLLKEPPPQNKKEKEQQVGNTRSKKDTQGAGDAPQEEEEEEQQTPGGSSVGKGGCGGIAGHSPYPELEKQLDAEGSRTDFEKRDIERQVKADIRAYVAQGRGNAPGGLIEWATAEPEAPKVDWREELAACLQDASGQVQSGGDDFSLARPSKRSYVRGMLRPGLIERLPEVAIVLDSSASMGTEQLREAAVQAAFVMEMLSIDEVWFAEADSAIALEFQRVHIDFFRHLEVRGRGGTDFRPAFKAAERLSPKADVLLYLTDGDGTAPSTQPPDLQVIWGIVPSYYNKTPANWGRAVFITDKK